MNPVKVIRLTTFLDFGGQEKQYISFTNSKNMGDFSYLFAAIGKGGFAERKLRDNGFQVFVFNQNPSYKNLKNIFILYNWFRKVKPDLVHTAVGEANFHGIIAARLAGVKFVVAEEVGFPNHSAKARFVFSFLYRFVNAVVCVSNSVKHFLISIGEISPDKGIVIYNPVSPLRLVDRVRQKCFTIVSVGRLEKVKNQVLLLKALSWLNNKSIKLILVGDGSDRQFLNRDIQRLDLGNQVEITGFVSEPEYYLAMADVFVLPSISEGFGIAAAEAMQLGIPCLCSNVGGIPEFITDGVTGWLFDPNDFSDFISKLEFIISLDVSSRDKVGERGMRLIKERFSESRYVECIENFYHGMIEND